MTTNHEKFLEHLDQSQPAVWTVARWLQSLGYAVTVNPVRKAPTAEQWQDYVDQGDLEIRQRVEVKKLGFSFSGPHDWPYKNFIVCNKAAYDRATPKPYAYIHVSADGQVCAVVKTDTDKTWRVERRSDRRYAGNYSQECYVCTLESIKWIKFP